MRDPRQARIIERKKRIPELLARGYTYARIGQALGVGTRQVQKYISQSPELLEEARRLQEDLDPDAVTFLRGVMTDESQDMRHRLTAATALLRAPVEPTEGRRNETVTLVWNSSDGDGDGEFEVVRGDVLPETTTDSEESAAAEPPAYEERVILPD